MLLGVLGWVWPSPLLRSLSCSWTNMLGKVGETNMLTSRQCQSLMHFFDWYAFYIVCKCLMVYFPYCMGRNTDHIRGHFGSWAVVVPHRGNADSWRSHAESGGLWDASATHQRKASRAKPYLFSHPKEPCCFPQELLREGVHQELLERLLSLIQWHLQIRLTPIHSSPSWRHREPWGPMYSGTPGPVSEPWTDQTGPQWCEWPWAPPWLGSV